MRRNDITRIAFLVLLVGGITALHYLTDIHKSQYHDIYRRLYYIPIVLGGLWYSLQGGLGCALAASALFAPHVLFQWGHYPTAEPEQYLEILLYNVIGFLTGFLAHREKIQKLRYMETARHLEESYGKLRKQADMILDIEEQLRRADRLSALGELSAGMAHEIRNPLGSIRGTAEILRDGIDPEDRRYEFAQILVKEVDRLNQVVKDFLDFAKPARLEKGRVNVIESLQEVLTLTRQPTVNAGIMVHLNAEKNLQVAGNREQLKQVFLNLVLNAQQAMSGGGELTITTEKKDKMLLVRFADTGQGIPEENLEKIFNPFFTTRQEGTGLGLAITHRILRSHGGKMEVKSRVGEGSVFTVFLPLDGEIPEK